MEKYVIIVAGGKGSRMLSETPKQFLNVAGKPLLMHTLDCFSRFDLRLHIILVLPPPFIDYWKDMIMRYDFLTPHQIIAGGESRFHSVKNGLKGIQPGKLVAVHDGVRPLVSQGTINRVFETAETKGNATPVMVIDESLRKIEEKETIPVNRNDFIMVQTPQCFHSELLLKAYEQDYQDKFTDDASIVELTGEPIHLVDGNYENIKITHPADIKIAEAFLS